jgi:hypothetical protein
LGSPVAIDRVVAAGAGNNRNALDLRAIPGGSVGKYQLLDAKNGSTREMRNHFHRFASRFYGHQKIVADPLKRNIGREEPDEPDDIDLIADSGLGNRVVA